MNLYLFLLEIFVNLITVSVIVIYHYFINKIHNIEEKNNEFSLKTQLKYFFVTIIPTSILISLLEYNIYFLHIIILSVYIFYLFKSKKSLKQQS